MMWQLRCLGDDPIDDMTLSKWILALQLISISLKYTLIYITKSTKFDVKYTMSGFPLNNSFLYHQTHLSYKYLACQIMKNQSQMDSWKKCQIF
jgi:hypothetical protein